jgi:hypothetical protein
MLFRWYGPTTRARERGDVSTSFMADDGSSTLPFNGRIDSVAGSAANVLASTLPIATAARQSVAFSLFQETDCLD